jgi:hypothetical protein
LFGKILEEGFIYKKNLPDAVMRIGRFEFSRRVFTETQNPLSSSNNTST